VVWGASVCVSGDPADLGRADQIVQPGVRAIPTAMRQHADRGLDAAITEEVAAGCPLLGICLGMQLLGTASTEAGGAAGLGLVPASVVRLEPTLTDRRIPHVGWNEVDAVGESPLLSGIQPGTDFYFVHSYHMVCEDPGHTAATTPYTGRFTSVVTSGHVHGVQFHPEKSQTAGFALLRNFLAL
jgi:glutamine amidotransferase